MVGTSDARGCGANFFYDGAGRLIAEDYFGCASHHAEHTSPDTEELDGTSGIGEIDAFFPVADTLPQNDTGLEVRYHYDSLDGSPPGALDADCRVDLAAQGDPFFRGRLVHVQDLATDNYTLYDGRGRTRCVATRIAQPYDVDDDTAVPGFASRYAPRWYGMRYVYDAADRVVEETTGLRELEASNGQSSVFTAYDSRGVIEKVTSSYDFGDSGPNLISRIDRTADNLVTLLQYGDLAETATTYTYDDRRRVHTVLTARAPPGGTWPAEPSGSGTYQMVLQDEQFFYDSVNNPVEIRDNRIPEEWPEGAKPVSKKIQYDDLYRASRIDYQYTAGDDTWKSPFEAELTGNGDPRRAQPSPHVTFAKRILWQTYAYDWLGNNIQTADDAAGFYDRSLGTIDNGTANDGPYQLRSANNTAAGNGWDGENQTGSLSTEYDGSGNLTRLSLSRSGNCTTGGACSQSFLYRWDELGRLVHAKRWDGNAGVTEFTTGNAAANLAYVYDASDERTIKKATDADGDAVFTLYVYPSLELRRAEFGNGTDDYIRDGSTEVGYLFASGVRLARVVNELAASDPDPELVGTLRVFFELGDHLGSTSAALDKATGELVERATYQAYGARESDYRPERWGEFREDYGFTGKEEDVEIGLAYFGKRFYAPGLQRWVSADPLEVHQAASGEPKGATERGSVGARGGKPSDGRRQEDGGRIPRCWPVPSLGRLQEPSGERSNESPGTRGSKERPERRRERKGRRVQANARTARGCP